ncbi:MAG: hypothetical protein ACTS3T_19805 [Almyronema sp.]
MTQLQQTVVEGRLTAIALTLYTTLSHSHVYPTFFGHSDWL